MFTRRKLRWILGVILLLLAAAGAIWLFVPEDPISQAGVDRIRVGMTIEEVDALLGNNKVQLPNEWSDGSTYAYYGYHGGIRVDFIGEWVDRPAKFKQFPPEKIPGLGPLGRLRALLPW